MDRDSGKKAAVFVLVLVAAAGLVTWGFGALGSRIGKGSMVLTGKGETTESFGGIGLEIAKRDGSITVMRTLEGTPADKAGVRSGDRIVKVNGEPLGDNPDIGDAVSKLRGKAGSEVTLTVKRGDETKTFTITREKIKVPGPRVRVIKEKKPGMQKGKPEEFWPFGKEWPRAWWGNKGALEEYREALRRLQEAQRKLWQSFPPPAFWEWEYPWRGFPEIRAPEGRREAEEFRMDMDVSESDDNIIVTCDMPGMKKEDIDVTLEGNVLTIKGERNVEEQTRDERGRVVRRERRFGSFSRSFTLPGRIKTEAITTSYKDGVLTIVIPKEKAKPEKEKKVRIKVGTI